MPEPVIDIQIIEGPVISQIEMPTLNHYAGCGAESLFIGRTRHEQDEQLGELKWLDYEMYVPMVKHQMLKLCQEAIGRYELRALRLYHSQGVVPLEHASVLLQAISPHRKDAIACVTELIEKVKYRLPVWKCEIFTEGTRRVAGNTLTGESSE